MFSRAAKVLELRTKALYFVRPREKSFGSATKSTAFCSAAQRNFWNCDQKFCILFCRAAKILDFDCWEGVALLVVSPEAPCVEGFFAFSFCERIRISVKNTVTGKLTAFNTCTVFS
jgi:hypothetical protein